MTTMPDVPGYTTRRDGCGSDQRSAKVRSEFNAQHAQRQKAPLRSWQRVIGNPLAEIRKLKAEGLLHTLAEPEC